MELQAVVDYEALRNARISENQARMASLGLPKMAADLRAVTSSKKLRSPHKRVKVVYSAASLRRSERLKRHKATSLSPSDEFAILTDFPLLKKTYRRQQHLFDNAFTRRCDSKNRGSLYDPVLGICCHFCRQKKLCGEEDCKRCGTGDAEQPCIGKTECSSCHSSNGILCRGCLKVRYGEEMEEVRENKKWMCPHCVEEKGTRPYWICNSSICLKKRNIAPTGIAIYEAKEKGFKSVAHLMMDKLMRAARN